MSLALKSLLRRFADQPDRYLKVPGGRPMSYPQFFALVDAFSEKIAALPRSGIVMIERSKNLDTVALAVSCIMKDNGFAFIDPRLPIERRELIQRALRPALHITDEDTSISEQLDRRNQYAINSDNRLFAGSIIFTSGSTGHPKGVLSSFDALGYYVDSMLDCLGLSPQTWLSICPAHFDVFQLDFLVQLSRGANIVVADSTLLPQQYIHILRSEAITEVLFISTLLRMISGVAGGEVSDTVRTVYFGGEGCSIPTLAAAMPLFPSAAFCQFYGPTENCNNTTSYRFSHLRETDTGFMPLGKPIKHVGIDVIDEAGRSCAPFVPGEIALSGHQLFHGYLDLETGAVEEWSGTYRSGDVGYFDDTGDLWFLGRNDDVVKVRGHRVSLQEINSKIQDIAKGATVWTVVKEVDGLATLVSGIHSSQTFEPSEVVRYLRNCLPEHSVPTDVVTLPDDVVKTLSTGKTDYRRIADFLCAS